MKCIFDRLHVWLAEHAPEVLESLRPGATAEAIRAAEREMGVILPDDVKACYRIHDGQRPDDAHNLVPSFLYGWQWLSLEEMLDSWRCLTELAEGGEFDDIKSRPSGPIREEWYYRAWIPFVENGGGDHYCLDLAPEPGGHIGQIIHWYHDDASRSVHAACLTEWLIDFADELDSGRWVRDEQYGGLEGA